MSVPVIPTVGAAVVVVIAGTWAQNKKLSIRLTVGIVFVLFVLTLLESYQPELAGALAMLILVAAVLDQGAVIAKAVGAKA